MSSNAATILSRKLFEVAGKASVLNCLTDPKRQADFDANRKLDLAKRIVQIGR